VFAELETMVRALNEHSAPPRSMFEWLGEIVSSHSKFQRAFDVSNPNVVRGSALALAATIIRGVRA
jgi:hypothetical protein